MASIDQHDSMFTDFPNLEPYAAIGVGPGLGLKRNSCRALCDLFDQAKVPMVIDADALNILAENKTWLEKIPEGSVLTPHPGEFRRLVGETTDSYDAIQQQIAFAKKYNCVVTNPPYMGGKGMNVDLKLWAKKMRIIKEMPQ